MTPEQLRAALQRETLAEIARGSGVHYNTVRNIALGKNQNPTYRIMQKIIAYMERRNAHG